MARRLGATDVNGSSVAVLAVTADIGQNPGADMDTNPRQTRPSVAEAATDAAQYEEAGKDSAIFGSEVFVERVLCAMALGARQATEEKAALENRPAKR